MKDRFLICATLDLRRAWRETERLPTAEFARIRAEYLEGRGDDVVMNPTGLSHLFRHILGVIANRQRLINGDVKFKLYRNISRNQTDKILTRYRDKLRPLMNERIYSLINTSLAYEKYIKKRRRNEGA